MSFTILAPAYYSSMDKVRYLAKSAERWGVPIHWYGQGKQYVDWFQVQVTDLIEEIKKVDTDYILYTDASDAIINDTPESVYRCCDGEIFHSVEFDENLCAGGWLAPKDKALQALDFIKDLDIGGSKNPQLLWREAIKYEPAYAWPDLNREVFQVADQPLEIYAGQFYNPITKRFPFLVHWAGGYTDPEVGKAALIEPVWRQLGYQD